MRSMTGYGEAAAENGRHAVTVSLKTVNHRFLDVQLRIAGDLRASEAALRELLAKELARGRVEARVEVRTLGERGVTVEVNAAAVRAAHAAVHPLVEAGLVEKGFLAGDLLRLPEALRVELAPDAWDGDDHELLLRVARQAVAQLAAGREREGAGLAAALSERLRCLAEMVEQLAALSGPALAEAAAGLHRRVAGLLATQPIDESRMAQEVALLAERSDIAEEIDRLRSHLEHFASVAAGTEPSGKRLDFLVQEVFRELNTLGAKCRNAELTRLVLDAKVLCEQVREQVQNVE